MGQKILLVMSMASLLALDVGAVNTMSPGMGDCELIISIDDAVSTYGTAYVLPAPHIAEVVEVGVYIEDNPVRHAAPFNMYVGENRPSPSRRCNGPPAYC